MSQTFGENLSEQSFRANFWQNHFGCISYSRQRPLSEAGPDGTHLAVGRPPWSADQQAPPPTFIFLGTLLAVVLCKFLVVLAYKQAERLAVSFTPHIHKPLHSLSHLLSKFLLTSVPHTLSTKFEVIQLLHKEEKKLLCFDLVFKI